MNRRPSRTALWRAWGVSVVALAVASAGLAHWAHSPSLLLNSVELTTVVQAYWWLASLGCVAALHFVGVVLIAFDGQIGLSRRVVWIILSLALSALAMLAYWLWAVELESRRGRSPRLQ